MAVAGTERRRRFVYRTCNTEYHLFDDVCIGVRDRRSHRWMRRHVALKHKLEGGLRVLPNGVVVPTLDPPSLGAPIYFVLGHEEQIVTSRLEAIERPKRADLTMYPAA